MLSRCRRPAVAAAASPPTTVCAAACCSRPQIINCENDEGKHHNFDCRGRCDCDVRGRWPTASPAIAVVGAAAAPQLCAVVAARSPPVQTDAPTGVTTSTLALLQSCWRRCSPFRLPRPPSRSPRAPMPFASLAGSCAEHTRVRAAGRAPGGLPVCACVCAACHPAVGRVSRAAGVTAALAAAPAACVQGTSAQNRAGGSAAGHHVLHVNRPHLRAAAPCCGGSGSLPPLPATAAADDMLLALLPRHAAARRYPDIADLWNVSDGTGRQRWRLIAAPQAGAVYLEVNNCVCASSCGS